MTDSDPLAGFVPHDRSSPFFDLIGPLLSRRTEDRLEFALQIDDRHVNVRGFAHGGVLSTFADVALGYVAAISQNPPAKLVTASLAIDFAGLSANG
jgi:acyl-coenzyme A thioesterase 13